MQRFIHHRVTIIVTSLIFTLMSLPWPMKTSFAASSGTPIFQDDFEGVGTPAWTVSSGSWSTAEGINSPMFSDDFENESATGWMNNGGSWSAVQNGASYAYRQANDSGASELVAGDSTWSNYAYEADVKLLSGAGAMMDFRYQDSKLFYYLYMSESYIRLMKQDGSNQHWIKAYDGPSLKAEEFVNIRVESAGNEFKVYLGGELVLSAVDNNNPFLTGKIGLATWATSIEFDNVSVTNTSVNHAFAQSDNMGGEAYAGDDTWSNYSFQTQVTPASLDMEGSIGIRLRQQDTGSGYIMQYTADGKVQILKWSEGAAEVLAEAPFSMQIGQSYTWNAVAGGKYLDLYINGSKLLSVVDASYTSGKIRLSLKNATASYDNVIVIRVTVPVVSEGNTTYYVSASTGDDENDGLSEAAPWRTLGKVNGASFQAGDQILLKSGDSWNEPLILTGSGTADSPIIITSYGTGAKPVIAWNAPDGGSVITGYNLSHWVIKGLAVQIIASSALSWSNITAGIQIHYDGSALHGNVLTSLLLPTGLW